MRRARLAVAAAILGGAGLSACSFAPAYQAPPPPKIADYKEAAGWTQAQPADDLPREGWWVVFRDPVLDGLEQRVETGNPTLAQALARYDQARAYVRVAGAAASPRVTVNGQLSRNRQSDNRPLRGGGQPDEYYANTLGAAVDYEIDFWGRVRNLVKAQKAESAASAADLASARLSLQAELADAYVRLRGLDAQADLLDKTVKAYGRTLALTQKRHNDGLSSKLDVDRANTLLETAKAEVSDVASRRAVLEHAVASLVGEPASSFALAARPVVPASPNVPPAVPSVLLQRRPDVAAAERRMAAANAQIGVAIAAFFPAITLDGSAGFQNTGQPNFFSAPNSYWGIGPNLLATLFDGGRRHALKDVAKAQFNEAAAGYRGEVLRAFQDVEDALAEENHLAVEAVDQTQAVLSAEEAEAIAVKRYQRGVVSYLDVVTAQAMALQAEEAGFDLATRRGQASIRLIRAIGGGWNADAPVVADAGR